MCRRTILIVTLAGLLAGCGASVKMAAPTIPTPLLDQINMTVGLRMPPEFEHFVHEESIYGAQEWSIDLGRSNAALFEQLLAYMFTSVIIIGPEDDPQLMALDAVIEPSIDAFEFSTPEQSNTEAFAVWIRYRLKVYDPEGKMTSNWPVAAYGKSQTTTLGDSDALQRAAVLAMRDAAALMIMKFDNVTRISSLAGGTGQPISPLLRRQQSTETEEQTIALESEEQTIALEPEEQTIALEPEEQTNALESEEQTSALEGASTDE